MNVYENERPPDWCGALALGGGRPSFSFTFILCGGTHSASRLSLTRWCPHTKNWPYKATAACAATLWGQVNGVNLFSYNSLSFTRPHVIRKKKNKELIVAVSMKRIKRKDCWLLLDGHSLFSCRRPVLSSQHKFLLSFLCFHGLDAQNINNRPATRKQKRIRGTYMLCVIHESPCA